MTFYKSDDDLMSTTQSKYDMKIYENFGKNKYFKF